MTPYRIPGQIRVAYENEGVGGSAAPPAASAPASSSAGSEASAPSTDTSGDLMNLGMVDDDLESIPDLPSDTSQGKPAAEATPPAAEPPVVPKPDATQTPQAIPPKVEGQQAPSAQAAEPPSSSPAEPPDLVAAIDANRDALVGQLAQEVFALSKEDVDALETDVVGSLPRMQARVFLKAVQTTHNLIHQLVPQLIERHLNAVKTRDEVENAFYGKFSGLKKAEHHKDVIAFAQTLRQVNPAITQDELWSMVAASVQAKYGLAAAVAAQQAAAQTNGARPPARPPQQEPFVPARAGATVRVTPEPDSPFMGMGRDYEDDEG
jgi:hypothetical protein